MMSKTICDICGREEMCAERESFGYFHFITICQDCLVDMLMEIPLNGLRDKDKRQEVYQRII